MPPTSLDEPQAGQPAPSKDRWSADELIPFGKYLLLNKINSGASAAVYRAKIRGEAGFERLVSIKRILPHMAGDPEFVTTFVREAKTAARLNHTNICPIYELGKVGESLYMAMEWIAGKDLGAITRRLHRDGEVMPPVIAAFIAAKLCDALDYAHSLKDARGQSAGIIHRDLSPTNIVVSYEGQVKLIDFGLAKAAGRAQQTNVDALKKKLGYMSPELVKGKAPDSRSDIFGVGVCLYEMVTGRRLFAGKDDMATLKMVSSASVPPPSALVEDAPEELEQIVMHALEREPEARWQTAAEMGHALMQFIASNDPKWTSRQLGDFMVGHFANEMAADQKRVNELLEASKDPQVLEERRRFFSSPAGAAAMAKAEVARRMSTMPPGAISDSGRPLIGHNAGHPSAASSALKTPALPRVALAAGVMAGPPSKVALPPTAAASGHAGGGFFEDEPTGFFDPARAGNGAGEDENTAFFDGAAHAKAAETAFGGATRTTPTNAGAAGEKPVPPPPAATKPVQLALATEEDALGYSSEKTEFLADDELSDAFVDEPPREKPAQSAEPVRKPDARGFEEEEATHIFFNKDDGTGIPDLLAEEPTPPPQAKGPMKFPSSVRVSEEALQPRAAPAAPPPPKPQPSAAARIPAAPRTKTGERMRSNTLQMRAAPAQRDRMSTVLLVLGIMMLVIAVAGLIIKTPLGVTLGIRKPSVGAIEVRTTPFVEASVKLDGVYRGRAPLRMDGVHAGGRRLELEADGYKKVERDIDLSAGTTAMVDIAMTSNKSP